MFAIHNLPIHGAHHVDLHMLDHWIIYIYILYTLFDTLRLLHDSCLVLASHAPPIHGSQVALCAGRPLRWNLIPQAVSTSGQHHSYGGQTKIDKQRGQ